MNRPLLFLILKRCLDFGGISLRRTRWFSVLCSPRGLHWRSPIPQPEQQSNNSLNHSALGSGEGRGRWTCWEGWDWSPQSEAKHWVSGWKQRHLSTPPPQFPWWGSRSRGEAVNQPAGVAGLGQQHLILASLGALDTRDREVCVRLLAKGIRNWVARTAVSELWEVHCGQGLHGALR